MKYSYYAVLEKDKDGGINVTFPDIICGVTCGDDYKDALYMAEDLLKLMITTAPKQCLKPSSLETLKERYPNSRIELITVHID